MKPLTRELFRSGALKRAGLEFCPEREEPERVLQFGEGNFLRAFAGWAIDVLREKGLFRGRVLIVQPIEDGLVDVLNQQGGVYTVILRGVQEGEVVERRRLITSVSRGLNPYLNWRGYLEAALNPDLRFVISNTTEAGIVYVKEPFPEDRCPASFPAKVAGFLYERYRFFRGEGEKGLVFLPCELIEGNGKLLKQAVLRHASDWGIESGFRKWLEHDNYFLNTLVDRIVPGFPDQEFEALTGKLGFEDRLLDTGEIFHLWVVEGPKELAEEIPFHRAGLNVVWTPDIKPYRMRKVRILNGAHTSSVLAAYLGGIENVRSMVKDDIFGKFTRCAVFQEVLPVLSGPATKNRQYAEAVFERFRNPFIDHRLLDISLNSVSKWKVRVLPSLLEYIEAYRYVPKALTFSLAALIAFYRGSKNGEGELLGKRGCESYRIRDDEEVVNFFEAEWNSFDRGGSLEKLVGAVVSNEALWGRSLEPLPRFSETVCRNLRAILELGARRAVKELLS